MQHGVRGPKMGGVSDSYALSLFLWQRPLDRVVRGPCTAVEIHARPARVGQHGFFFEAREALGALELSVVRRHNATRCTWAQDGGSLGLLCAFALPLAMAVGSGDA